LIIRAFRDALSPHQGGLAIIMPKLRLSRSHPTHAADRLPLIAMIGALLLLCSVGIAQQAPVATEPVEAPEQVRETILPDTPSEDDISPAQVLRDLPRFGAELFASAARAAAAPQEAVAGAQQATGTTAPVPANYTLGPGDALSLQVHAAGWPQVAQEMTVSPEGFIFPDQLGRITAAGQSIEGLRSSLQQQYSRIFTTPTVTLAISSQRAIDV